MIVGSAGGRQSKLQVEFIYGWAEVLLEGVNELLGEGEVPPSE